MPRYRSATAAFLLLLFVISGSQLAESEDPAGEELATVAEPRIWKAATGDFSVEASLVACNASVAVLQKLDGKEISVALDRLSDADRAYLAAISRPAQLGTKVMVGKVIGVTDGDTLTVLDATKKAHKIRLEGIDAPESHQAFGTQSKKVLSQKVFGRVVRVEWKSTDKYGRTLGSVYQADYHVNLEMIAEGMAWHYTQYSSDSEMAKAERDAKLVRAGLWDDPHAVAPWDFRRGKGHNPAVAETDPSVKPQPPPAGAAKTGSTVYITKTGTKYHRAGCRHLTKSSIPIDLSEVAGRYGPCSNCNPPAAEAVRVRPLDTLYGAASDSAATVYVTKTGAKYHRSGCRFLSKSKIALSLDEAKSRYSPCSVCGPP